MALYGSGSKKQAKEKKNSNYAVAVPTRGREDLLIGILEQYATKEQRSKINERDRKSQAERGGSPATKPRV
jgi:hypothetical protein